MDRQQLQCREQRELSQQVALACAGDAVGYTAADYAIVNAGESFSC